MAGTVERTIALKLIGDVADISKDFKRVDTGVARVDKRAGKLKATFKGLGSSVVSWGKAFSGALLISGVEKVTDAIGDAWEGFRSGQKVAAQLGVTWRNLGFEASGLTATLDRVTAAATRLGVSDDDAVLAFNTSIKRTKDSRKSYRELQIAMDLVANGAAPNLEGAMRLIEQASKGSSRVVDRFGLKSKTAGGRVKELGEQVKGAARKAAKLDPLGVLINGINEDLEGIVGSFATGDIDGAIDAIAGAAERLDGAWSKVFPNIQGTLDNLTGGGFGKLGEVIGAAADAAVSLQGALQNVQSAVQPLIDVGTSLINVALLPITTSLDGAIGALRIASDLLKGDFDGAMKTAQKTAEGLADTVSRAFEGMLAAIRRIAQNVVNVWNSLGKIDAGSFQLWGPSHWGIPGTDVGIDIPGLGFSWGPQDVIPNMGNILRQNWGTGGGNGPSGGLNKQTRKRIRNTPDAVGNKAPAVPGHEAGLDRVPFDDYMARLHKDEAVLNARAADAWRGGMAGGTTVIITVNAGVGTNGRQVGEQIIDVLVPALRRGGAVRLKAALGN